MHIIDLSHSIKSGDLVIDGMPAPELKSIGTIKENGYALTSIAMHSHTGTHVDAPAHIIEGTRTLTDFPVSKFYGKGIQIQCQQFVNQEIPLEYLKNFEKEIKITEFIILNTGWHKKWNTPDYFKHFPFLSEESARWLTNFQLKGIAIDTISMDPMESQSVPNHNILLGNEILIIENLANTDALGHEPFIFQCFPVKFNQIDGSPARAVAMR